MLLSTGIITPNGWLLILLGVVQFVPGCTLVPRFILGLRALYARDLQGRRGSDIDAAFCFSLASSHGATVRTITFAHAGENEGLEQVEEIQMEIRRAGSSA